MRDWARGRMLSASAMAVRAIRLTDFGFNKQTRSHSSPFASSKQHVAPQPGYAISYRKSGSETRLADAESQVTSTRLVQEDLKATGRRSRGVDVAVTDDNANNSGAIRPLETGPSMGLRACPRRV